MTKYVVYQNANKNEIAVMTKKNVEAFKEWKGGLSDWEKIATLNEDPYIILDIRNKHAVEVY